jgi:hypothetical protein
MLCLIIGAYCEALGLCFRLMVRTDVHSTGKYIVMYLFVVLSVSMTLSLFGRCLSSVTVVC